MRRKAKTLQAGLAVLLATALLLCVFPPGATAGDETRGPGSHDQIKLTTGGKTAYHTPDDPDTPLDSPSVGIKDSESDATFNISKKIGGTGEENIFDITLTVTSSNGLRDVDIPADAAVIMVLDVSGSMLWTTENKGYFFPQNNAIPSRKILMMDAAKAFIADYGASGEENETKRLLSLVRFASKAQSWNYSDVGYGRLTDSDADGAWLDVSDEGNREFALEAVGKAKWSNTIVPGNEESLYSSQANKDNDIKKANSSIPKNGINPSTGAVDGTVAGEPSGRWDYSESFFGANGATNIEAGLQLAYNIIEEHSADTSDDFNGFYHVILLTDGEPNGQLDRLKKPTSSDQYFYKNISHISDSAHIDSGGYVDADGHRVNADTEGARQTSVNSNAARAQYVAQGTLPADAYTTAGTKGALTDYQQAAAAIPAGTVNARSLDDLATIHTVAFITTTYRWLNNGVRSTDPDKHNGYEGIHMNAGGGDSLTLAFQTVRQQIERMSTAFNVEDPMSAYTDLVAVKANNDSFLDVSEISKGALQTVGHNSITLFADGKGFDWRVKDSDFVSGSGGTADPYVYELTYRVRLNANAAGPEGEVYRLTNDRTVFSYFFENEGATGPPNVEQAEFRIPKVRPNLGALAFVKTDADTGAAARGATFTLQRQTEGGDWSAPLSVADPGTGADFTFAFNNLAAGNYRLSESISPTGYSRVHSHYHFRVAYGEILSDAAWAGANAAALPDSGADDVRRIENKLKPPGISASKTRADDDSAPIPAAGGDATYEILIENTSAAALRAVVLTDEIDRYDLRLGQEAALPATVSYHSFQVVSGGAILMPADSYYDLEIGETGFRLAFKDGLVLASGAAISVKYMVGFPDNETGRYVVWRNNAKVSATPAEYDGPTVSDESDVMLDQLRPEDISDILLTKTAGGVSFSRGEAVPYTVKVTNTGEETLKNILIKDSRLKDATALFIEQTLGNVKEKDLIRIDDYVFDAANGEIKTTRDFRLTEGRSLTIRYVIVYDSAGEKDNTATVTATGESGKAVEDSGTASV
ncbi:MAG: DUF11 domain-containing protein, partial [Clostridiales Family XIII bacterium]|nr:DUF11 domain-containing protein [Clostridiales Family XIII bacterium]